MNVDNDSRQASAPQFATRRLDVDGAIIEVGVAGAGDPVLCAGMDAAREDRLAALLAEHFTVVAIPFAGTARNPVSGEQEARRLAAIARELDLEAWHVCLRGSGSSAALHLAARKATGLRRAALLSPDIFAAGGALREPALAERLDELDVDMLALFGTDAGGEAAAEASCYRERLPRCWLTFVYDAPDPARDRPEAVASVIADFLTRGEGFLVNNGDGALYP